MPESDYQALLVVSFGGPEGPDDVVPFLENVLRGKNVPRQRMLAVADHYRHFGGVSPLNAQVRALIAALEAEFGEAGLKLPIYWGNRNWHPLLPDTVRTMRDQGVRNALAFFTSAYSSYSSCRQYRENIEAARQEVGSDAPRFEKLRAYFNHPEFIAAWVDRARDALQESPAERRPRTRLLFTAHSIPAAMAVNCRYEAQLTETARLVAEALDVPADRWKLVFQSRSGPPSQPWLEPDIVDHLHELKAQGVVDVVIVPIGFISDHVEVLYDLDVEARQTAEQLGIRMTRASTLGTHPRFVRMIRDLVMERISGATDRPTVGRMPAVDDVCPVDCCLNGR